MSEVTCFMVAPIHRARRSLRRYRALEMNPCPGRYGFHNATIDIEEVDWNEESTGWGGPPRTVPVDDPRWPAQCDTCDYRFGPDDPYQENDNQLYEALDGRMWTNREFPPGAMFWADWDARARWQPALYVALPPGGGADLWCIDAPASGGGFWERTGVAPVVTVTPSILTDRYHGFLTNGVLREC